MTEPLLNPENNRHTLFPIQYPDLYKLYRTQIDCFWRAEEIDLSKDYTAFQKLSADEQHFIKHILAFFAASDGIVIENLVSNFCSEVKVAEARACYAVQEMMETIHSHTYSLLIESLVKDKLEKDKLFNAVENYPAIKQKADWGLKWIGDKKRSYGSRLVAFACVEGVQFSGAFCSIYWLKTRKINMDGLTFSNELISRDEALHLDVAVCLFHKLQKKPSTSKIYEIIKEAVEIEKDFICEALPCRLIGMNNKLMSEYIEFVADRLCSQLGVKKIFNTANPFDFMESISLEGKTNFFEKRVGDYALAQKTKTGDEFKMDLEF